MALNLFFQVRMYGNCFSSCDKIHNTKYKYIYYGKNEKIKNRFYEKISEGNILIILIFFESINNFQILLLC